MIPRPRATVRSLPVACAIALAGLALALPATAQVSYKVRITNNNLVGLTTTNYGFFGNNFVSRSPSFEYPLGTGFEHIVRGGLWIGGLTQFSGTGEDLRVSTAAVDGSQGTASASGTEYTPLGNQMLTKLRVYAGPTHPRAAQGPQPRTLTSTTKRSS